MAQFARQIGFVLYIGNPAGIKLFYNFLMRLGAHPSCISGKYIELMGDEHAGYFFVVSTQSVVRNNTLQTVFFNQTFHGFLFLGNGFEHLGGIPNHFYFKIPAFLRI